VKAAWVVRPPRDCYRETGLLVSRETASTIVTGHLVYFVLSQANKTCSHKKIIPVESVEALRVAPTFSDIRLTDGGKVVSPRRRPLFTPQEDSWYSFLIEAESTPGP
jgi:hypothetical protein